MLKTRDILIKIDVFYCFVVFLGVWSYFMFLREKCFLDSSTQNHAEASRNYIKKLVLEPTHAKFYQNSDFGHVRTYC